jgi:hypothetical protein
MPSPAIFPDAIKSGGDVTCNEDEGKSLLKGHLRDQYLRLEPDLTSFFSLKDKDVCNACPNHLGAQWLACTIWVLWCNLVD